MGMLMTSAYDQNDSSYYLPSKPQATMQASSLRVRCSFQIIWFGCRRNSGMNERPEDFGNVAVDGASTIEMRYDTGPRCIIS
jgi:hypothetical protein